MLSPKRTKFRKQHRGRMRGVASKGNTIAFGQYALQAQDCGWVTAIKGPFFSERPMIM